MKTARHLSFLMFGFGMLIVAAALGAARRQEPAAPATPAVWPRTFEKGGDKIVMYQPQVDSWKDQAQIAFRCALAISPQSGAKPTLASSPSRGRRRSTTSRAPSRSPT